MRIQAKPLQSIQSYTTKVLLTCEPGIEHILCKELQIRISDAALSPLKILPEPYKMRGTVRIESMDSFAALWEVFKKTRTIYHVHELIHEFAVPKEESLAYIRQELHSPDFEKLGTEKTFRVSCRRSGQHSFSSYDILREVGAVLQDRYQNPVDLEHFEVHVRVDIIEDQAWVGYQHTRELLSDRFVKTYLRKYTLKPALAFALLSYAGIQREAKATILDSFCGSCTIAIEASYWFPSVSCYASDLHPEVVEGATENVQELGLEERIQLRIADARKLSQFYPHIRVDAIVANPPFGLRMGKKLNLYWFYHNFLSEAKTLLLSHGRIVLLLHRTGLFRSIVSDIEDLEIIDEQGVEAGGKHLRIFVLAKVPGEIKEPS